MRAQNEQFCFLKNVILLNVLYLDLVLRIGLMVAVVQNLLDFHRNLLDFRRNYFVRRILLDLVLHIDWMAAILLDLVVRIDLMAVDLTIVEVANIVVQAMQMELQKIIKTNMNHTHCGKYP